MYIFCVSVDQGLCVNPQYEVLSSIRRHIVPHWTFVGYSLHLKYDTIDNIKKSRRNSEEQAFQMLVEWMQTDSTPCYCKLISVMDEHRLSQAVIDLKMIIKSGTKSTVHIFFTKRYVILFLEILQMYFGSTYVVLELLIEVHTVIVGYNFKQIVTLPLLGKIKLAHY